MQPFIGTRHRRCFLVAFHTCGACSVFERSRGPHLFTTTTLKPLSPSRLFILPPHRDPSAHIVSNVAWIPVLLLDLPGTVFVLMMGR